MKILRGICLDLILRRKMERKYKNRKYLKFDTHNILQFKNFTKWFRHSYLINKSTCGFFYNMRNIFVSCLYLEKNGKKKFVNCHAWESFTLFSLSYKLPTTSIWWQRSPTEKFNFPRFPPNTLNSITYFPSCVQLRRGFNRKISLHLV